MPGAFYPPIGVPIYSTLSAFPNGGVAGELGVAQDTGILYEWSGSAWQKIGGPGTTVTSVNGITGAVTLVAGSNIVITPAGQNITIAASGGGGGSGVDTIGAFDGQPAVGNALFISGTTLYTQSATTSNPGMVNNSSQTFSGNKSFTGDLLPQADTGSNVGSAVLRWFQGFFQDVVSSTIKLIGSTSGTFTAQAAATTTDYTVTMPAAQAQGGLTNDGSGNLSWALASGSVTGALKSADWTTFNNKQSAITTGNLTSTPTTNLVVTGGTGAVIGSGALFTLTGASLVEATSSVLTITGATNAVLGTGVSIQVKQAATAQNGYLSSTDWNTFNGKQAAGNYVTALTGDVTASGPGSVAATLATVNSNVGSFTNASLTVNAKGLVTAASNGAAPVTALAAVGAVPNANAASISGNTLNLQPFNAANPGVVPLSGGGTTNFLRADGSWSFPSAPNVVSKTANYIAVANDFILSSTNPFTVTLPTASGINGQSVRVKKTDNDMTAITSIATTGGQTIDGNAANLYFCQTINEEWVFVSDGSNWIVNSHLCDTPITQYFYPLSATSAYVFSWTGNQNLVLGDTYTDGTGKTFTVSASTNTTTGTFSGNGTPAATGTLTRATGTGVASVVWTSRTITGAPAAGTGTNSLRWWRTGQFYNYQFTQIQTVAGTTGSGMYIYYFLPPPLSIDSTITQNGFSITNNVGSLLGNGYWSNSATGIASTSDNITLKAYSSNQLFMCIMEGRVGFLFNSANTPYNAANFQIYLTGQIPISGWLP